MLVIASSLSAQQTITKYLSGTDKDNPVLWDFYCTTGHKSEQWSKIAVPSNWELQGFGTYNYFEDTDNPDEAGLYKYKFTVPSSYHGQRVFIVFEGAMTDTEVKINGRSAGEIHQGGYYRFKYDISRLIKLNGDNLLEVKVTKKSANLSINKAERRADFWQFGGIYRPVYLELVPATHIDRVAIDAKADGNLHVDVYTDNLKAGYFVSAQLESLSGKKIGKLFGTHVKSTGNQKVELSRLFKDIKSWNPEFPHLYNLVVAVNSSNGVIHRLKQRFGFRTMELRPHDGIYVNNRRVVFKGVCRHSEWPESGRALSKSLSLLDVKLMKEMNMNAVRMSHYPPDQHFLDVCDSLGLFVLDELTGWQAKYDTLVGRKLVKELVVRDVNHPSIVLWDNGNEGGWNTALDHDYALYDPQKRPVIHPWEKFNNTDTKHYPDYNYVVNSVLYGKEVFFPTEFMHGNYDGGGGAALDDFWSLMLQHPYFAGGFLWSFSDEGVIRTDKNGQMDTANDSAPDGLVGPHREKEGSFYTVKEIWSPVFIEQKNIPPNFNGRLLIENRYLFTDLYKCTFSWKLKSYPSQGVPNELAKTKRGKADYIKLSPGEKGYLQLNLPKDISSYDAFYLTANDPYGKEIFTWSWPLTSPDVIAKRAIYESSDTSIETTIRDQKLIVKSGGVSYEYDSLTGYLAGIIYNGKSISLSNGPLLAGAGLKLKSFVQQVQGKLLIIKVSYDGDRGWLNATWIFAPGKPVNLKYQYSQKGDTDFMGITFKYPEDKITGMKWLGRGPYHSWKNRLKGQQFGIWQKDYNNTITGETWQYPEFKGYHSEVYWVEIENTELPFKVYTEDEGIYLQMLKPNYSKFAREGLKAPFPDGDIGFLNAISPMGTRFQQAGLLGPQSQKNIQINYTPISGSLWLDFRQK